MTNEQALDIIAEAINKGIACNIHSKAEIAGLQAAYQAILSKLKPTENEHTAKSSD